LNISEDVIVKVDRACICGSDLHIYHGLVPDTRVDSVEILESIEQPRMPAVFGTTLSPSGLSGVLRRFAFKFDESEYGHWLNLLFADRINVVEGIIDDLKRFHIPNIFAEKGIKVGLEIQSKRVACKSSCCYPNNYRFFNIFEKQEN
jgi:hypothetical protein